MFPIAVRSRTLRFGPILCVSLLTWCATAAAQESASAAPVLPRGVSLLIGGGWSTMRGTPSRGGGFGGGLMGVSYERPLTDRLTWRLEGGVGESVAEVGELAIAGSANTLHAQRTRLGGGIRRYGRYRHYLGVGANLTFDNWCFVRQQLRDGSKPESLDCPLFSEPYVTAEGSSLEGSLSLGIERKRFALEARYDHGFTPVVRVDNEALRASSLNAVMHVRLGRVGADAARTPRAIPPLPGQLAAAGIGWGVGALGGLLIGAASTRDKMDFTPLLTALAGSAVGTTTALHIFGRRHGVQSNVLLTFGGTVLGMVGGPALPYTMPLGGVLGYNSASRERKTP